VLDGNVVQGSVMVANEDRSDQAMLWHKRLGHISDKGLYELKKHMMLGDVKSCDIVFYEYCIMGKAHTVKFNRSHHVTQGILDHVDSYCLLEHNL
jgi:hypothetical protein